MSHPDIYELEAIEAARDLLGTVMNSLRENIERYQEIMLAVRSAAPRRILDVGCHVGVIGSLLRWNHGYRPDRIVGVDLSPTACSLAVQMGYDRVVCANIEDWEIDEEFDLVIASEIIEHLKAPMTVTQKLCAAAPRVLFTVPVEDGDVDGVHHLRKVEPSDIYGWAGKSIIGGQKLHLPSSHGEKPHWQGWTMILAETNAPREQKIL